MNVYSADYFDNLRQGSRESAQQMVPLLLHLVAPSSVVDVGCGVATWLSVFGSHAVEDVLGIDGAYVAGNQLEIPARQFLEHDLTEGLGAFTRSWLSVGMSGR